ncbi:MAG TPA: hypothetical protein VHZ03_26745 [Trebonia sp.]|nr:hypothetical protein [Trebonia sp.]
MTDYMPPAYPPPAACPRCRSSANVHTIREMLDMMTMARDQAMQGHNMPGAAPGAGPARPGFRVLGEGESPDAPRSGHWRTPPSRRGQHRDFDFDPTGNIVEDLGEGIAGAALSAGMGILGRAIGKRVQKAFEERVMPAVQQRAEQTQQEMEQVATRYPDLRVCQHDQVVFLEGGHATVPLSEIRMPVTMASADAVVARLRGLPVVGNVHGDDGGGISYRDMRADRVLVEPPADAAAAPPGSRRASR